MDEIIVKITEEELGALIAILGFLSNTDFENKLNNHLEWNPELEIKCDKNFDIFKLYSKLYDIQFARNCC